MSSFVFNSFKKRYLQGQVPTADNWTFIPVSDEFKKRYETDDVRLDQYRSISDFKNVSPATFRYECSAQGPYIKGKEQMVSVTDKSFRLKGRGLIDGCTVGYNWSKSTKAIEKPIFVNSSNSAQFYSLYNDNVSGNNFIIPYINAGGFYYIKNEGQLKWFAERSKNNNNIIGVFGTDLTAMITDPIGPDENKPFEGILDGNFQRFSLKIKGRNTDNGLVGILGKRGVVRNFKLKGRYWENTMECDKQITLNHIKTDGRDINCGILVGRNYGWVENIDAGALEQFNLYAFVPSVYSVTNKSDKYKWNEWKKPVREKYDGNNDNFFYLNSFCINSPANICPYVGYFNEGKFSEGIEGVVAETNSYADVAGHINDYTAYFANNGETDQVKYTTQKISYPTMGNFWAETPDTRLDSGSWNWHVLRKIDIPGTNNIETTDNVKLMSILTTNPYYYGLDSFGKFTVRNVGNLSNTATWTVQYNSNLIDKAFNNKLYNMTELEPSYSITRNSLRLHPNARAAFNVGTIIGANYGTIERVQVSTTVKNTSNFVGFIGGLVGKQANGKISNVSIFMNNQFTYDFGSNIKYGDVVYYKQTPILPDAVKSVLNEVTGTPKDQLIEDFFSPWYENNATYSNRKKVNTAANITDDVIAYKLRPIFVVGGLFGRFTPNTDSCELNNVTVLYKDNYNSTKNTNYKRPENAFGIIAGKVDYSTMTYGVEYDTRMYCNNCKFSALTTVGEPYNYYSHYWDGTFWSPNLKKIDNSYSALISGTVTSKYVGIYELKNNVYDPITYNANKAPTAFAWDDEVSGHKAYNISLEDFGIYYAGDYPMDMSSHNAGIVRTHILWNKVDQIAADKNVQLPNGESWDVHHMYYEHPNYDPNLPNAGRNKRNMAEKIINLNGCFSNIDNFIDVYDDYMNQWKLMSLPPYPDTTSGSSTEYGIPKEELDNNKYTASSIEFIKRYWSEYRSNSNASVDWSGISADLKWSEEPDLPEWSGCFGYFHNGLVNDQTQVQIRNGIENAFDGYTTINFARHGFYSPSTRTHRSGPDYIDAPNWMDNFNTYSALYARETNCFINSNSSYCFGRTFKKNVMHQYNTRWSTTVGDINYVKRTTFVDRPVTDSFSTYEYSTWTGNKNKPTELNSLYSVYGYTLPVHFATTNTRFGYVTDLTEDENKYGYVDYSVNVGQYMTPEGIANKIEDFGRVNVTSISSKNGYGGLLVVDSSGRNVMFFDNDNGNQLTGNTISYPTEAMYSNNKWHKNILKVE